MFFINVISKQTIFYFMVNLHFLVVKKFIFKMNRKYFFQLIFINENHK